MPRKFKVINSTDGGKFQLLPTCLQEMYKEYSDNSDDVWVKWRYVTLENVRRALKFKRPQEVAVRAFDIESGKEDTVYHNFDAGWGRFDSEEESPNFSIGCKVFIGQDLKDLQAWANKPVTRQHVKPPVKTAVARVTRRR